MIPRSGNGRVVIEKDVNNGNKDEFGICKSTPVIIEYSYPVKLIIPQYASLSNCQWLYVMSYGGGLVERDKICLDVTIGTDTGLLITTQGATKVYRCEDKNETTQSFNYNVHGNSLLCLLPEPTICFDDANYTQKQEIMMENTSSLVLLDWLTSGRMALGESWQFYRYHSVNTVYVNKELVFKDNVLLQSSKHLALPDSMNKYKVICICLLLGHRLKPLTDSLVTKFGSRQQFGEKPNLDPLTSVSRLDESYPISGCILRFCSTSTSQVYKVLNEILKPVFNMTGGNPLLVRS